MKRHSISTVIKSALVSTTMLWSAVAGPALGETSVPAPNSKATLTIELNSTEQLDTACRLTFTAKNSSEQNLSAVVLETVLFGTDGAVITLTLFDFQDLPTSKPRVRQFDMAGITCDSIGQILINGVATCDGSTPTACQDALTLSSRTKIEVLG